MSKHITLGILGLGTVGGGVVNVLQANQASITNKTGATISVLMSAVKDTSKSRICADEHIGTITEDAFQVVNSEADIILELIGGTTFAKDLVATALRNKKHVVTANKALIATHGNELLALAHENGVQLLFEAAVAGGIPVLKALEQGLSANQIASIAGIINGTGNFILTEMRDKGRSFDDVLAQAQALGYAEADPTFDIEGMDAGHKLAILTSMGYACHLAYDGIAMRGISHVKTIDTKIADELGFKIKHLALSKREDNRLQMSVQPTLIPKDKLLASVDGVMNAVMMIGNAVGETMYYGAGAGSDATASSVLADVIDIINQTASTNTLGWQTLTTLDVIGKDDAVSEYYLRLLVADTKGVLAEISTILADDSISIENMVQHPSEETARIAIITGSVAHKHMMHAIAKINNAEFTLEPVHYLHVETFK